MKLNLLMAGLSAAVLFISSSCVSQSQQQGSKTARQSEPGKLSPKALQPAADSTKEQTRRFLLMPLDFEVNGGQAPAEYSFVAHGPSYALGISSSGLALSLHRVDDKRASAQAIGIGTPATVDSSTLRLNFVGVDGASQVSGVDRQQGRSSYFIGNNAAKWQTAVPHYDKVKISGAYPGIDLVFYGNRQQLEYDFAIAPGADAGRIALRAEGVQSVSLDAAGNAILKTAAGDVELKHPVAYQQESDARQSVDSEFEIANGNELKIRLGKYDRSRSLVIDPVLEYGVAFGGSNGNEGLGIALDSAGNTYITGNTCSADFPSTAGNFQNMTSNPMAVACQDAFVTKINPTGSSLIYSDYIGGSGGGGTSTGSHIAVDASGNVYIAGATRAIDFPTVSNIGPSAPVACAILGKGYNCPVGFVLKLSPDGSQLLFSSLLGGSQANGATQIKLNSVTGDLDVVGVTDSSNFLPAANTLETTSAGGNCANSVPCFNGFLVGLDSASGQLRYSTYLGAAGSVWPFGLAVDGGGNLYVSGMAQLPLASSLGTVTHTYGPSGGATAAGESLFVEKLNLSANSLTPGYLTVIEGDSDTSGTGIGLDATGNLYFTGMTAAQKLAVTSGVFQTTNKNTGATYGNDCLTGPVLSPFFPNVCGTGLVGKLDTTGTLSFLSYLGGSGQDIGAAIAPDSTGNIWVTGATSSTDFPVTSGSYTVQNGFDTPFLAEVSNDGSQLEFASLIAGSFGGATDLLVDSSNNVFVAGFGSTAQSTPGTYPSNPQVYIDTFVQKWGQGDAPSISVTPSYLNFPAVSLGASTATQTMTVQNTGTVPMQIGVQLTSTYAGQTPADFPESTTCGTSLAAGASCTISVAFAPGPPSPVCVATQNCDTSARTANVVILNNATQGTQQLSLSGSAVVGPSFYFAPNPIVFPAQAAGTSSPQLFMQGADTGDSSVAISNIALSGPNASDFQLILTGVGGPDCVSNPVQPGSLCDLEMTFNPPANATGTRTAVLTFTDTAGDSPQSIPVSGLVATTNYLNLSPVNLAPEFPVAIGTSTTAVLNLQNPSTTNSVQVTTLGITGANMGDFSAAPASCGTGGALPMTIPANSTCYLVVTFTPASGASGKRVATLTVQTTPAATGLPTVSLSGIAVTNSQSALQYSEFPNPLNFGGLQVGETSNNASVLLSISNYAPIPCAGGATSCGAPLVISSITPGLSDYTLAYLGQDTCTTFPATIPVDGTCTYNFVFTPSQAGSRNTTVSIVSNDPQGTIQLPLYGSGLSLPLGEALQSALDFGNSAIGVASPPMTTTLKNAGQSNLVVSGVTTTANFAVSANTCTGPIAPQGTCTIAATFTPPSAGPFTGTLTVSDNDPFGPQQIVTMAGTGATGPQVRITPASINFGNQPVNSTSAAQTLTLASTGDAVLTLPASGIRSSADFLVQSTTCGTSLPVGNTCTVNVQYKPTVVIGIPEFGSLLITDNGTGSPQPVYLQGQAVPATTAATTTALISSLNPSTTGQSVMFTATVTGPSGNLTIPTGSVNFVDGTTIIGSGTLNGAGVAIFTTSSLSVASHAVTAVYAGDTNFSGSTSPVVTQVVNSVAKAASTTIVVSSVNPSASGQSVTFTATVTGPTGDVNIPSGLVNFLDGSNTLGSGTLNGSGVATFSTSSLSAGSHSITAAYVGDINFTASTSAILAQVVNAPSKFTSTTTVTSSLNPSEPNQSVTFTSVVSAPVGNLTIPTGMVTFMDGSSSLGTGTLNGSATTTFTTTSLSAGAHTITAVYAGDSNFAGSTSAALTQTVNGPSFTFAFNPTTVTVTAGQTATTTVSVTPTDGFNQQISFTCSGLPAASTCTFSPATVTPSGANAATTTLTIATNVTSASLVSPMPLNRRKLAIPSQALLALVLLGLGGIARRRRTIRAWMLSLALLAAIGLSVSACGGKSSGGGGSSGASTTPKGTGIVTVTANSGNITKTATFTLTVQ